jgi:hypothetical protein
VWLEYLYRLLKAWEKVSLSIVSRCTLKVFAHNVLEIPKAFLKLMCPALLTHRTEKNNIGN